MFRRMPVVSLLVAVVVCLAWIVGPAAAQERQLNLLASGIYSRKGMPMGEMIGDESNLIVSEMKDLEKGEKNEV